MLPANLPLQLYRGDTARLQVKLYHPADPSTDPPVPVDLTDAVAKSQIRERPAGVQITELACSITLPNIVDVTLDAAQSHLLPSKGAWDLQITFPNGDVQTPVGGPVTVMPDVTDSTPTPIP